MNAAQASLRIGDFCRFDGQLCELIALDGVAAKLRRSNGQLTAVKLSALFSDNGFEILTPSVRRRPIPPAYFDSLPTQAQERALWLEHHITEGPRRPASRRRRHRVASRRIRTRRRYLRASAKRPKSPNQKQRALPCC